MKTQILFSTNNLPGSVLIRVGTWSDYSHVDIISPDRESGLILGATPWHGVSHRAIEDRIDHSTRWMICEFDADPKRVWAYAESQIGKKYDWLGCLGIAVHRDWEEDDKWFCSELVAKAALQAGVPLINRRTRVNRVTPQMLLDSPLLTVYDGEPYASLPGAKNPGRINHL
jgi:hypothetical protein